MNPSPFLWVGLFGVIHTVALLFHLFQSDKFKAYAPAGAPEWIPYANIILTVLALVFLVALFKLKKWGFWGYALTSLAMAIVQLTEGHTFVTALTGLGSTAIIFASLHVGKEDKVWPYLE